MFSLVNGVLTEDFQYGYPYSVQVQQRPPTFDYQGTALTNAGYVVCPQGAFSMQYGNGSDNPDAVLPYGGSPDSNPYYLRYPVLSWGQAAGIFATLTTTGTATLTFDRAFSGYVGDQFIVTVNGTERLNITGSSGYSWTRNTITLGRGVYQIAFLLVTAPYSTTVTRSGTSQSSTNITQLNRYLRLTNLQVTACAAIPQAHNTLLDLSCDSSVSGKAAIAVTTGPLTLQADSRLLCPMVISDPVLLVGDSAVAVNASVGKYAQLSMAGDSALAANISVANHHYADTGGFAVSTMASLSLFNTNPVATSSQVRSLRRTSLTLGAPSFVNGTPQSPLASCISEVSTRMLNAQLLDRVDPYGPGNTPPVTATYRWLSIDAQSDSDNRLTQWNPDGAGPVWATPGDYRPTVGSFAMKTAGRLTNVNFPAVQFDASHLEHLACTVPRASVNPDGVMTWVFIGSFARYRGALNDNCPIIDFASDAVVDYTTPIDYAAIRNDFMPWVDNNTASSLYLGLTSYSDKDLTSSQFAFRTDDNAFSFDRSPRAVVSDATPVVIIYRINGGSSCINVTPLVAGHTGSTQIDFSRGPIDFTRNVFTLGKSRVVPPYSGSFLTGSMSLLEVGFFNTALTNSQIATLANFYTRMYVPVVGGVQEPDYTVGQVDASAEQVLLYAADPETPLALLTGNTIVQLKVYPSTAVGRIEMQRFNKQGVPTVQVTNRDYAALLAQMELT